MATKKSAMKIKKKHELSRYFDYKIGKSLTYRNS